MMKEVKTGFKVMYGQRQPKGPILIPWEMVESHRGQAFKNHGQSLERLNERGGLGVEELYAVLQDIEYRTVTQIEAVEFLLARLREFQIDELAQKLAGYYQGESCGICACLGIECYNPSDRRWWEEFLTQFNKEDIEQMVRDYVNSGHYPK